MTPRGRGTILFTGATASLRGGSGFAVFAGGKHALGAVTRGVFGAPTFFVDGEIWFG